jgi:hypothetical protein
MRFLCGLKGVTLRDRQGSEDVRNSFEVDKMTDDMKELQKWRSHVNWMPEYRLPRRVFNCRLQGKQDIGRP